MNDGNNIAASGRDSAYKNINEFKHISQGEVVSVIDPDGLGRIKVRIKGSTASGGDDGILDSDLPWAIPMLPKHLNVQPVVNEGVLVMYFDVKRPHSDRLYFGPVISQPQKLAKDPYYFTAWNGFSFASQKPNVDISTIPELNGVFPDPSDVSIQGRYNTDITQKNNEIVIRAGKFVEVPSTTENPFNFKFNSATQAFIQIKDNIQLNDSERGSIINVVGNKINLITHKGSPNFNVTNQQNLISDEEMLRILSEAHRVPFGEILIEYLILMKNALFLHVHNGHGNVATDLTKAGNNQAITLFKAKAGDLENRMLSENVRIN